ncbi:hypothetical protein OG205_15845 [Lentzea sp. NBC_00516]|uniref:hypothetical protein n=1 Tax=Lentzea sp. NBC_00516 TaxID=2903582 RepID=UPI002E824A3F|nr:hypothetical protein [Lentzea sp. NBC_00516]WUD28413.1 hypothetical protein OG205_15845 [Lentzea sp. NBC_00516]
MILLAVLNGIVALVSTGFAIVAAVRPSALSHESTPTTGERFYAWMYAVRGVPLGLLVCVVPFLASGMVSALVLITAAVVQAGDAAIGAHRREARMTVAPALASVIHVITAIAVAAP